MTMGEAIAQQPQWVGLWLKWLFFGAFVLPVALLIWRQTRLTAVVTVAASISGAFATGWLYGKVGYVKLLGLPHIVVWTPLVVYLYAVLKRPDLPKWPRWIVMTVIGSILISLAFDYTDVLRYLLGERTPFPGTLKS